MGKLNSILAIVGVIGFFIGLLSAVGVVPIGIPCPPNTPVSQCSGYTGVGPPTGGHGGSSVSYQLFPPGYSSSAVGLSVNTFGSCSPSSATLNKVTIYLGSSSISIPESYACGSGTGTFSFTNTFLNSVPGTYVLYYCVNIVFGSTAYSPCSRTVSGIVPTPPPANTVVANFKVTIANFTGTFVDQSLVINANISSLTWTWGDGTSTTCNGPNPFPCTAARSGSGVIGSTTLKMYGTQRVFIVTETLTFNGGQTASSDQPVSISVSGTSPPTVSPAFLWTTNNLTATFSDATSVNGGSILRVAWMFGDGTTGSGSPFSHTYTSGNTYSVVELVTVNGNDGSAVQENVTHSVYVTSGIINPRGTTNQTVTKPFFAPTPIAVALMLGFGSLIFLAWIPGARVWIGIAISIILALIGYFFL